MGRLAGQVTTPHEWSAGYQLARTFWNRAFTIPGGTIRPASSPAGQSGAGGRDIASHSLAIGETWVLSNTMINNVRVAVNRTRIVRTHADMFGPEDVGVKMYSHVPHYMNITTTGAFSINTGTETFSFYKPNTLALSDDFTKVRGNHQYGIGGAMSLSDWKTESNVRSMGPISFNGAVTGLPLGDFLLGRMFEFRESTPFRQDITQPYTALYVQDTWRVSPRITVNYGARWEPWFPQNSKDKAFYAFDMARVRSNTRSTVYPQAPAGLYYPGDPGFPGTTGMKTVWSNIAPRLGLAGDPGGDGRPPVRVGYGMAGGLVAGHF